MSETTDNLRRMIEIADTRGAYQIDGADARWLESAIETIERYEAALKVITGCDQDRLVALQAIAALDNIG